MLQNAWLVPLFPLISFILIVAFGRQLKERAAYVGITALALSFITGTWIFWERLTGHENYLFTFDWVRAGDYVISMGYEVNELNAMMLFVVTTVSFMVHIYSKGYMHGDPRFPVFYQYLSLFTFSMLSLVISPNLLQAYIFWEMVGVTSFLLIGFFYYKESAKAAAKKAFITTRFGDLGIFIGMGLIYWQVGSFDYGAIFSTAQTWDVGFITLVSLLIFFGAMGKSGQFPLHIWLPDAMEGPTPVSALIHAATMVAAGVYLVARLFPLFELSENALFTVALVGGFTAIFAASIGLVQNDIKRVLAYSTVSQLGFMMLSLGAAGYVAGVFHLFTHAFFKALLFLTSGSVIHAVHTQDIKEMGGLRKHLPITHALFLIGAMAISGVPFLAGFYSKDEILMSVYAKGHTVLFWMAIIAATFTAFYMFRLYYLTFHGKPRHHAHPHESPASMLGGMIPLGILAIISGYFVYFGFGEWLSAEGTIAEAEVHAPHWIMWLSITVALLGIGLATLIYGMRDKVSTKPPVGLHKLLFNKYYVDEIYGILILRPYEYLGYLLRFIDLYIVDGLVKLAAAIAVGFGRLSSRLQNGQVQTYTLITIVGIVIILVSLTVGGYIG